jgi:hypothetical protein
LSYLEPPPMPAPVIVMKDVGGFVTDYQSKTALYRASDREVRLHECRSACTLALSLPNVCVYPDSLLKFHLAYDPRNHEPNAEVSQQLFASYPPAVQARLGTLTRNYKVLTGSELIKLGVRDCNEPRTLIASAPARKSPERMIVASHEAAPQQSVLGGLMNKMMSVFGTGGETASTPRERVASVPPRPIMKPTTTEMLDIPLPPPRPAEFTPISATVTAEAAPQVVGKVTDQPPSESPRVEITAAAEAPLPPPRPMHLALTLTHKPVRYALPKIITGGQPILPPGFSAYAEFDR